MILSIFQIFASNFMKMILTWEKNYLYDLEFIRFKSEEETSKKKIVLSLVYLIRKGGTDAPFRSSFARFWLGWRGSILENRIVAKALDGQRYLCPTLVGCGWSWGGSRAAAPKGSMTYAFTHMGDFLLLLLLLLCPPPPQIPVLTPKFQSWGPNPSLEA